MLDLSALAHLFYVDLWTDSSLDSVFLKVSSLATLQSLACSLQIAGYENHAPPGEVGTCMAFAIDDRSWLHLHGLLGHLIVQYDGLPSHNDRGYTVRGPTDGHETELLN